MQPPQKKDQEIHIYLTTSEKNTLCRQAALEQKSVSKYLLDLGLGGAKKAKNEGIQALTSDLTEIKKQLYVLARFLVLIGAADRLAEEEIIEFFQKTNAKADQLFDREA